MISSFLQVHEQPSDDERRDCAVLGFACALMADSRSHAQVPLTYVSAILIPAISHRQIKIYFNEDGAAVCYVIWAMLAEDVERRAMQTGQFSLHESEWNEGGALWILDFLAPHGNLKYMLSDMRDRLFAGHAAVRYLRIKNNRRLAKELARNEKLSFFSQGQEHSAAEVPA